MNKESIEKLREYIETVYDGNISEALESIGGLKLVREILGLKDYAVLDPKLYKL